MKTLKCEVCEAGISGEDWDDWFKSAHEHWRTHHSDLMRAMKDKPKEEGEKWIADKKKEFEDA